MTNRTTFFRQLSGLFKPAIPALDHSELHALVRRLEGRVLLATRFTPEDQVLLHWITESGAPIRVYTHNSAGDHDILTRTVDFFGANIELYFRQSKLAAQRFAQLHPDVARAQAQNPATAPLTSLLEATHVQISSLRQDQIPSGAVVAPYVWDETRQCGIYYPLFSWTERAVAEYVAKYRLPLREEQQAFVAENAGAFARFRNIRIPAFFRNKKRGHTAPSGTPLYDILSPLTRQPVFGMLE